MNYRPLSLPFLFHAFIRNTMGVTTMIKLLCHHHSSGQSLARIVSLSSRPPPKHRDPPGSLQDESPIGH